MLQLQVNSSDETKLRKEKMQIFFYQRTYKVSGRQKCTAINANVNFLSGFPDAPPAISF
jgi:hypothetical protein